jgi:hypothetical protein
VIGVIVVIGLMLTIIHGIEAMIWATAYWATAYLWLGALRSSVLDDAMLYSVGAMTTLGVPEVMLQRPWQIMGRLEAINGMLLFGTSTAFIFAMMQSYWPMLSSAENHVTAGIAGSQSTRAEPPIRQRI